MYLLKYNDSWLTKVWTGKMEECAMYSNSKLTIMYTTRYNYNCRAWHMTTGDLQK